MSKVSGVKGLWCKMCLVQKGACCKNCLVSQVFSVEVVKGAWCKSVLLQKLYGVQVVWCKRCPWIGISVRQSTVALGFRDSLRLVV